MKYIIDYNITILFETISKYSSNSQELDLSEININASKIVCAIIYDCYKESIFEEFRRIR